jgi:hypothetical protein
MYEDGDTGHHSVAIVNIALTIANECDILRMRVRDRRLVRLFMLDAYRLLPTRKV